MKHLFYSKSTKYDVQSTKTKSKTKTPIRLFSILFSLICAVSFAQEKTKDTIKVNQLDEVLVSAVRVTTKTQKRY
jgi:iron complex outermembrane receptor protein